MGETGRNRQAIMNCKDFEIEWAGLEDASRLSLGMEEHRTACRHCAELVADLTSILEQARELRHSEEPPQRVWVAIRNQLEQEGLIREPVPAGLKPGWKRPPAAGWFFRLPMGLAYTAVFFIAVGVMYVHSLFYAQAPPIVAVPPPVPEMAYARPDTSARDKAVEELLAKVPADRREVFVSNWNQVNSSIQNWQNFEEQHPDDPFAPQQLMNARQQKEQLWENLVRWDEF
jgi:hypothetical protein